MKTRKLFSVLLIVCLLFSSVVSAQEKKPPRLVVVIVVDQLTPEYLTRFRPQLTGGFDRLLEQGAVFTDAHHNHANTVTGAGHATIVSGLHPRRSGIIHNSWFDRTQQKVVKAIEDPQYPQLIEGAYGVSPLRMNGPTLGEWMKHANPRSQVVSISLKDRAAVLMGGKSADQVYWHHAAEGKFTSSRYYFNQLPSWVEEFNQKDLSKRLLNQVWTPLLETPDYLENNDELSYEGDQKSGWGSTFPHRMPDEEKKFRAMFESTPWADQYVLAFAREAVKSLKLGQDDDPDLLLVSLSTTDLIGHKFGPDSMEMHDQIIRLDRTLGKFFSFLESTVALENFLMVVTSDHGVCPIPEHSASHGKAAQRVNVKEQIELLDQALAKKYNVERLVRIYHEGMVYFDDDVLSRNKITPDRINQDIRNYFMDSPVVERIYSPMDLAGEGKDDPVKARVRNSFWRLRSGDLMFVFKENVLDSPGAQGTDHGSPHSYDTHVPLIFFGGPVEPGRYDHRVHTVDIAPAIAAWLGISPLIPTDGTSENIFKQKLSLTMD